MKDCSRCRQSKAFDDFNWRNKAKGWRRPECKACQHEAYASAKARDPEVHNTKRRENKRKWRLANGVKPQPRRSREQQIEFERARRIAWYKANREKAAATSLKWRQSNKDKIRECHRRWYEANKSRAFEKARRRRALKLHATIQKFTLTQLEERLSVFGHRCAYCGGAYEELDHVKPLSRGGPHCLANLRPSCLTCNRRKWAKMPSEMPAPDFGVNIYGR